MSRRNPLLAGFMGSIQAELAILAVVTVTA